MGTQRFRGRATAPPLTVTARWVRGLPFIRAERTIYTVATLNTEHFTSSADWPGGTSRPVTVRISCFSMPRG